jgi:hypothetical protein
MSCLLLLLLLVVVAAAVHLGVAVSLEPLLVAALYG